MTLSDLAGAMGIPLSTLQRMEGKDDVRVGYQDVAALAKFYDVSIDFFGLTDNRQLRHIEIDTLSLSDKAIETLKDEKLNNRLVSEIVSHDDFTRLMRAVWIYLGLNQEIHGLTRHGFLLLSAQNGSNALPARFVLTPHYCGTKFSSRLRHELSLLIFRLVTIYHMIFILHVCFLIHLAHRRGVI